ncbi:unnamed protein product [Candidula unifasciata]|uniref:Nitric oxide-associated protein 1 n=1 Tax=Candidula unifasciata TaxID=100452 RepID=A0A8S3ZHL0_9EUPU|nr:unnamed protein product [Candidula unifasciata]
MHAQMMRLVHILNRRRWHSKTIVHYLLSSCIENPSVCMSYSVIKMGEKLITEPANKEHVEKPRPYEFSLLAKKIVEQNNQQNVADSVSAKCTDGAANASFSPEVQKRRLEELSADLVDTLIEPETPVSRQAGLTFSEAPENDRSVESVVFQQDLTNTSTFKPSPVHGTEDQSIPASNVPCVGCGAHLHCQHNTFPGFLPSELFKLLSEKELKVSLCQRCYYIRHCDAFVEVSAKPEEFAEMISKIKPTRSVVVMVVDVMDIQGSIIPDLLTYIGNKHPLVIVGNKADLLAPDCPEYLENVKKELKLACQSVGLHNIFKCTLISAKTGFGIERLINQLFSFYTKKLDVFIVGTANAGKSSLFNTLLASDYCKNSARDLIQRATISAWPGTTLNLLKFPITRPERRTVALRNIRLRQQVAIRREEAKIARMRKAEASTWELKEEIKMTDVRTVTQRKAEEGDAAWGQVVYGYNARRDGTLVCKMPEPNPFEPEKYEESYWTYDTPGIINPDQIVNLLTPEEAPLLAPASMIVPRCLFVRPGDTVFVSGLARLDYLQGEDLIVFTVHAGPAIPINIVATDAADQFYEENIGTATFGLPIGNQERLSKLPPLEGREFTVEAAGRNIASADIQLSSIGWVSVGLRKDNQVLIKAYTPGRKGLNLRTPALMPRFLQFMGKRKPKTPFFHTEPPGSAMVNKDFIVREDD